METCEKCENGLVNTGIAKCSPVMVAARGMYLVNTYDSAGVRNFIDLSSNIDDVFLTARLNDADKSKRWYPLMGLNNVVQAVEDTVFDEPSNGIKYFVRKGKRSISAEIWGVSEQYISKIDNNKCSELSAYIVDINGKLTGIYRGDDETKLYPVDISSGSWDSKPMPATDSTVSKGMISFDWSFNDVQNQKKLRVLNGDTVTADFISASGLVDVVVTVGAITATSVTFTAMIDNGGTSKIPFTGLLLADVIISEPPLTTQIATAVSATATAGQYIATLPSQTTGDSLRLTITKTRFDFGSAKTILIP
jgi:hypothetical protein